MKALEITIKNINKLAFIYEQNSYCIVHAHPIVDGALSDDMQALWESDYLFKPIQSRPTIEPVITTSHWENTFVGLHVDSMDTLRALLIQSIDYSCVFFDNHPQNIKIWKALLVDTIKTHGLEKDSMQCLFELNRTRISETNKMQIWWKADVVDFDDGLSAYKLIVTGTMPILEYVYQEFLTTTPTDIGEYRLFSFADDTIEWIDI